MSKKQPKPGLGIKPKAGETKLKIRKQGQKGRVWVIVKRGTLLGGQVCSGQSIPSYVAQGQYLGKRTEHPLSGNPMIELEVDGKTVFVAEGAIAGQNAEVEVKDSDEPLALAG